MAEHIVVEGAPAVPILRLNRPEKLNALTPEMLARLAEAVGALDEREDLRALILTGTGRAFCVGADIGVWARQGPEDLRRRWIHIGHRAFDRLARRRVPVIAALNGDAFGGGLELALAADLRIVAQTARLGLPEASIGAVPGWGGTQRLPALIGPARAKQMIFTAQPVDAATALSWGLANWSVPAEAVADQAQEVAAAICRLAPPALEIAKMAIDAGRGLDTGATLEALAAVAAAATEDAGEGTTAFAEKRPPVFKGR